MEKLIIGSHTSYTKEEGLLGSVKEALSYGANTFMFYTGAPQNTIRTEINEEKTKEAHRLMKENNITNVIVHAPYIVNLANNKDSKKWNFSINFLKEEIERCKKLKMDKIVLHPGSHVGLGVDEAINNIASALNIILKGNGPMILLETMAGKGTEVGATFEEISEIIEKVENKNRIMVCLDTCHVSDAGYNLNNFEEVLEEFENVIGLEKLKCIHINDSKNAIGSHKDRHENIGFGEIGFDNLIKIIYNDKLKDIPKILETPYISVDGGKDRTYPPYKFEIQMIKNKKMNNNLLEDIRAYYK